MECNAYEKIQIKIEYIICNGHLNTYVHMYMCAALITQSIHYM